MNTQFEYSVNVKANKNQQAFVVRLFDQISYYRAHDKIFVFSKNRKRISVEMVASCILVTWICRNCFLSQHNLTHCFRQCVVEEKKWTKCLYLSQNFKPFTSDCHFGLTGISPQLTQNLENIGDSWGLMVVWFNQKFHPHLTNPSQTNILHLQY